MKLADLRKLAIRRQVRIRFPLPNGMECVVDEHGVAKAAGLRGAPSLNLEEELASAQQFQVEPAASNNDSPQVRAVLRSELEAMLVPSPAHATAHEEE